MVCNKRNEMMEKKNFARTLNNWYRKAARDLPWRKTKDPYKIWISEIMLQQTTVSAGIPYYLRWIKEFPTIKDVSRATLPKVLKMWQGLGYYQRARNLHAASKILVKEFQGKIPKDPQDLRKLPGFGPYTVGAVLSIAYDIRIPIVDANVRRVFMRILAIQGEANTSCDEKILKVLNDVLPKKNINIFNQALMELGALVCSSRQPHCLQCPLKSFCKAYKKGIQEIIPTPKKMKYKNSDAAIGVIRKGDKYFIQQRDSKGLLANMWEFPGGKVKKNEGLSSALKRELAEECGITLKASKPFMNTVHFYTNNRVKLHVFLCEPKNCPGENDHRRWVTLKQMQEYPMPSGSARIVQKLIK